jgi:hypothetical protein
MGNACFWSQADIFLLSTVSAVTWAMVGAPVKPSMDSNVAVVTDESMGVTRAVRVRNPDANIVKLTMRLPASSSFRICKNVGSSLPSADTFVAYGAGFIAFPKRSRRCMRADIATPAWAAKPFALLKKLNSFDIVEGSITRTRVELTCRPETKISTE